jgi:hypothetical protein
MEEKMSNLDIDLEEFSKETLISFIQYAHENDYTMNEAIVKILESVIKQIETENTK